MALLELSLLLRNTLENPCENKLCERLYRMLTTFIDIFRMVSVTVYNRLLPKMVLFNLKNNFNKIVPIYRKSSCQ